MKVIAWNNIIDAVYSMVNAYVDCPVQAWCQHSSTDSHAASIGPSTVHGNIY